MVGRQYSQHIFCLVFDLFLMILFICRTQTVIKTFFFKPEVHDAQCNSCYNATFRMGRTFRFSIPRGDDEHSLKVFSEGELHKNTSFFNMKGLSKTPKNDMRITAIGQAILRL